jgi:IMP dehydrogenase
MVKAFAAGADAVMLGSMLAGHDESPGEYVIDRNTHEPRKVLRGMASEDAQRSAGRTVSGVEGIATTVPGRGPVAGTLDAIRLGLGSGCSYAGVSRLAELRDNAAYIRVSGASLKESAPHGR